MTADTTLAFGARRHVPVRYDRDLVQKTLKAMERVNEIRARRERVFYKKRMAGNKERELARARRLVAENEHLLPRLRGSEKKRLEEEGVDADEIEEEMLREGAKKSKGKVFGAEKRRLKVRLDGGVEEIGEQEAMAVDSADEMDVE